MKEMRREWERRNGRGKGETVKRRIAHKHESLLIKKRLKNTEEKLEGKKKGGYGRL